MANHIEASDAFRAEYPNYSFDLDFARKFLGGLMGGEGVPEALMDAAVDLVVDILNHDPRRGVLALAAVEALLEIDARGADHPAYADLGGVAARLANQAAVAEHYTVSAEMADASSTVLAGVTSDDASVTVAIDMIDNPPAAPVQGREYILETTRDNIVGTAAADRFIAEPVAQVSNVYEDTLDPFDAIDGGGGIDTLEIYGVVPNALMTLGAERISNIENVIINTVGAIDADMRSWTGLETVDLRRFGRAANVEITVDGAVVNADMTFGGDVTIVGADGAVNIAAGKDSTVKVGSAGHTESATVKGGDHIVVDSGAETGNRQSDTMASVSVDGLARGISAISGRAADPDAVTLAVYSDAIADVALASTEAVVLVHNDSKTADSKPMPEDLLVTVNKYGAFKTSSTGEAAGELRVDGAGSAENIDIAVTGDSVFNLASNTVKTLDISVGAKLKLDVNKFTAANSDAGPSETLEIVKISGAGAVEMNDLSGMKKLATIDAGGSSGDNSFKSVDENGNPVELAALESVTSGSGNDTIRLESAHNGELAAINTGAGNDSVVVGGAYRDDGLMVNLGAGNDSFVGGAGNGKSRVDGGAGRDTLKLSAGDATYESGGSMISIYSNFELLDVGGGSGAYNVGRPGVDSVVISASTAGTVALNEVAGGTPLSVSGSRNPTTGAGVDTSAVVEYNLAESATAPGSLIDGGSSNIVNVSLAAMGGKDDTKTAQSGKTSLTITLDDNLRGMRIDSNAGVHAAASENGVVSGHYENTIVVPDSEILEVEITGNAQTNLSGDGLDSLRHLSAMKSGASVTVNASSSNVGTTLAGSNRADVLTSGTGADKLEGHGGDDTLDGGDGADELTGGAGGDTLTGGGGADEFIIHSQSESVLSFKREGNVYKSQGHDTITDFGTGDRLLLSQSLYVKIAGVGEVKEGEEWEGLKGTGGWMPVGTGSDVKYTTFIDGNTNNVDGGAADLRSFIGDGRGLFLTTLDATIGTRQVKNSIALIEQAGGNVTNGLWLLFDIDGDGDFEAGNDMVIFLQLQNPTDFTPKDDIGLLSP